jgi:dimethylhistidine N-methyltransferase
MNRTPMSCTTLEATPSRDQFYADVCRGLDEPDKELPCKYFYDEAGSRLFDRITELREYYPTRTELAIMQRHAAEMAEALGSNCLLLEYGSGSSVKTRLLLAHLRDPVAYIPIDISGAYLRKAAWKLAADYPGLNILPLCADFSRSLTLPKTARLPARRVVYFPGSTIGNFTPGEATALLQQTARLCGSGGGLLLGADLKKDPLFITAAYNDAEGVTAAFNLNLLTRINRELAADFQVDRFWHHAFYNPREGRIEMHLVSQCDQSIHIGEAAFFLAEGESIRTECSYKYSLTDLRELAHAGGFEIGQVWTDRHRLFSVLYLKVR